MNQPGSALKFQPERLNSWGAPLILAAFLALAIAGTQSSAPRADEAGLASAGYNLAYNGFPGTTIYEPRGYLPDSMRRWSYFHFPAYFFLTAAWFKLIGFGLFQVRLISTLFGLLGLMSWYWIARRLSGSAGAGLVSMGLVAADYFYLFSASNGRMDMMCCGLGAAALAAYLYLREKSLAQAVLASHAFATLCVITHPIGGLYYLCLVMLILALDRRRLNLRIIACGAAPVAAGVAILATYIFQDSAAFLEQMRATMIVNANAFPSRGLSSVYVIRMLQLEVSHRYIEPFGLGRGVGSVQRLKVIVLAAYVAGIVGNLYFGKADNRKGRILLALMPLIAAVYMGLVSPSKFFYYLAHVTAFCAASFGVFLCSLSLSPSANRLLATAGMLVVGCLGVGGTLFQISHNPYHRIYLPVIKAIRMNSTPRSIIMGPAELWFALDPDRYIIDDPNLGYLSKSVPDVFVMNDLYRNLHEATRSGAPSHYTAVERLLKTSREIYRNADYSVYLHDLSTPTFHSP